MNALAEIQIEEWRPDRPEAATLEHDVDMLGDVVVVRWGARIVGTVQLDLAVPPNQQHRAKVAKLLVHPAARRRGVARALMTALEAIAQSEGRTLLTLDTVTGGSAEPLYLSLGYISAGVIPRYARGSLRPDLEATTIMYKELAPAETAP
jgi:GNAT superfamily N-acetyltransferase